MMRLAAIWRHPIKSHGRERLDSVALQAGKTLPWDRRWAVAHDAARIDRNRPAWAECVNFSRGSKAPRLMAINASLDAASAMVTLTHPDHSPITFCPNDPADHGRFLDWVRPLCPPERAQPAGIYSVPDRGMTDTDYPSISILNLGSNSDLSTRMGIDLSPLRWRGNLWLEGGAPWVEAAWPGQRLRIGEVEVEVVEPIVRCTATTANPETGIIDADTLRALRDAVGAQTFGVYARVLQGGTIRSGDSAEVLT